MVKLWELIIEALELTHFHSVFGIHDLSISSFRLLINQILVGNNKVDFYLVYGNFFMETNCDLYIGLTDLTRLEESLLKESNSKRYGELNKKNLDFFFTNCYLNFQRLIDNDNV